MFLAVRRGLEVGYWRQPQSVNASGFKSVISDVVLLFGITALFGWLFSLLLPASEAPSHTVPFITSAYPTNLLSPHIQSDRLRPQKFNKSQSSSHSSTAKKSHQNRAVFGIAVIVFLFLGFLIKFGTTCECNFLSNRFST